MNTIYEKADFENPDMKTIEKAAEILRRGGVVAFPTETVYGLGANGFDEKACAKIYAAKGRPSDNPLILHIGELEQLEDIAAHITADAKVIIDAFWPGPITLILPKQNHVPSCITGGLGTVAIRFPANKIARLLINTAGVPIAAPSANISGSPSPTTAWHVKFDLDKKIDMIVDGGPTLEGLESTIVDVTGDIPVILRPGSITKEMLDEAFGYEVLLDSGVSGKIDENITPKAPGMKYKHYSPKADLILVEGEKNNVIKKIIFLTDEALKEGLKVGVLTIDENKDSFHKGDVISLGSGEKLDQVSANLYSALREFDNRNADIIFSETFKKEQKGAAIMNRLYKAAGYKCISV